MSEFKFDTKGYTVCPSGYKCGDCGTHGVKLWRSYSTFLDNLELRCATCLCPDVVVDDEGLVPWRYDFTDQIKSMVSALPTPEGDTFWGYTSACDESIAWWKNLPTYLDPAEEMLWSVDDGDEDLNHTDLEEAAAEALEDLHYEEMPAQLRVHGFVRSKIDLAGSYFLDDIYSHLEENYGNPHGKELERSDRIRAAADELAAAIKADVTPWACDRVCERLVNVRAFMERNHPDELEEFKAAQRKKRKA